MAQAIIVRGLAVSDKIAMAQAIIVSDKIKDTKIILKEM
jgi:hypothetical protein